MYTRGPVIVMELPEQLNHVEAKRFLDELQPLLEVDRPSVVLDCSQIKHMDSAGVEMLLHCLEQAMKRDGDLKLAAISPASAVILELMRSTAFSKYSKHPKKPCAASRFLHQQPLHRLSPGMRHRTGSRI